MTALRVLRDHAGASGRWLATAVDGRRFATCDGLAVRIYDAGTPIARVASPGMLLFGVGFCADPGLVCAPPRRLDLATSSWIDEDVASIVLDDLGPAASGFAVHDAAVAAEGRTMLIRAEYRPPRHGADRFTGYGQRLAVVDVERGARRSLVWEGSGAVIGPLAVTSEIAVAALDGLRAWPAGGGDYRSFELDAPVTALAASADGAALAVGLLSGGLALVRLIDGRVDLVRAHEGAIRAAAHAGDSGLVATGGEDGAVRVWRGGALLAEAGLGAGVDALAFFPDGDRLLASVARPSPLVREFVLDR
jgi:hypothetical protein